MSRALRIRVMIIGVLLVSLMIVGLAGCGSEEPETIAPETPDVSEPAESDGDDSGEEPAADPDLALVESKCSGCHTLDRVWAASYDAAGWESTVRRMEANGLQLSDEERTTIVEYLAAQ